MLPDQAKEFHEQIKRLLKSEGEFIPLSLSKSGVLGRSRPQDPITTTYRFVTSMRQEFAVTFRTFQGEVTIVIDPPVGDVIVAYTVSQGELMLEKLRVLLELECGTKPPLLGLPKREKVLA